MTAELPLRTGRLAGCDVPLALSAWFVAPFAGWFHWIADPMPGAHPLLLRLWEAESEGAPQAPQPGPPVYRSATTEVLRTDFGYLIRSHDCWLDVRPAAGLATGAVVPTSAGLDELLTWTLVMLLHPRGIFGVPCACLARDANHGVLIPGELRRSAARQLTAADASWQCLAEQTALLAWGPGGTVMAAPLERIAADAEMPWTEPRTIVTEAPGAGHDHTLRLLTEDCPGLLAEAKTAKAQMDLLAALAAQCQSRSLLACVGGQQGGSHGKERKHQDNGADGGGAVPHTVYPSAAPGLAGNPTDEEAAG